MSRTDPTAVRDAVSSPETESAFAGLCSCAEEDSNLHPDIPDQALKRI
jgi:hypothetical protein